MATSHTTFGRKPNAWLLLRVIAQLLLLITPRYKTKHFKDITAICVSLLSLLLNAQAAFITAEDSQKVEER